MEEGSTTTTGRWAHRDWTRRRQTAPEPAHSLPDDDLLLALCSGYTKITGDQVRSPKKAELIGYCFAVHGHDFLTLVEEIYSEKGTATNLLGRIRLTPARPATAPSRRPEREVPMGNGEATVPTETQWLDTPSGREARATWGELPTDAEIDRYHADLERIAIRDVA